MSRRVEIGLVAIIVALAAALRLLWIDAVPIGWHYDEALMGIMASEVFRGIQRPIFFQAYLGQEPLYVYLSAGTMWLMGGNQDFLPLRVTSALVGIATVAVTYVLGRELFGRRVGIIGAALIGFSFWQLMLSRNGYRVITQPLLEGLAIFLLWRAARQNSVWWYAGAGAALGGTIYTYLGARMFPGVLVAFAVWWVLARGWPPARARLGLGVFVGVAAAVAAPLAFYFITHPGMFSARIEQVYVFQTATTEAEAIRSLAENIGKLLATFTLRGDTLWRFNIDGRPIFVGAVAPFFYVGLVVAGWGVIRRGRFGRDVACNVPTRAPTAMMLAWLGVMLFPSFLSVDPGAYTPRSMGLAPMLFLVPAIGMVGLWDWAVAMAPRVRQRALNWACTGIVAATLLADGAITYRDYFVVWANSFGGAYQDMADVVAAARFLDREARPGEENLFVSTDFFPQAVIAHLAPMVYPQARWFDGNSVIVLSPVSRRNSLYVFPYSALPKELDSYLPSEAIVERSFFPEGPAKMVAYRLTPGQVEATVRRITNDPWLKRLSRNLGDEIELIAYRLDRRVEQGDELSVTGIWRVLKDAPARDYVAFAHLLDHKGAMWGQDDVAAFPTSEWRTGDIVVMKYSISVGKRVAPGKYAVALGIYDRATLDRLPVKGEQIQADTLHLDFAKVASHAKEYAAPGTRTNVKLGEAIELLGLELERLGEPTAPSALRVDLYWQARATPAEDYTVFVQLLDAEGRLVAQADSQPVGGRFPTSYWEAGETIVDRHEVKLGGSLPFGRHRLIAGMYLLSTGKRLAVEGGGDYVSLAEVEIGR
ncbi:MAG: glycosyltransferase family 39 protein [Chloroflexi bacterium]|nr:glycosyltransferase family 39 protein [Chloroflexota bacterium]